MNTTSQSKNKVWQNAARIAFLAVIVLCLGACGSVMTMVHGGAQKPAASEFGLGPRTSARGLYTATLESPEPLRTRKLQTLQVKIQDASASSVDGATIAIDGGMPQHGHGLPTKPRVTKNLGGGVYVIEGVRFNMGGWWEFKVAIQGAAGPDTVTFNIAL